MRGLLPKLRRLGAEVNSRTHATINFGGCAVYAAAVAARLEAMGIPAEVVTPATGASASEARDNLRADGATGRRNREWDAAGLSRSHFAVRFKNGRRWYTHDTDVTLPGRAFFGERMYPSTTDGLTPAEAWALADDANGWNSSFDRGQVPLVRGMVWGALA